MSNSKSKLVSEAAFVYCRELTFKSYSCIDYLRQSLMCHADTNLEPVDWEAGGVTGWGSQRTCRNYQAVVEWANEFRTHDQTDIS